MWIEPVTDRTESDLEEVRAYINALKSGESVQLRDLKGALNYTDLSRIETDMAHLANIMNVEIETRTSWTYITFPRASDMMRILSNAEHLADAYYLSTGIVSDSVLPEVPKSLMTYEDFNALESFLLSLYLFLQASVMITNNDEAFSTNDGDYLTSNDESLISETGLNGILLSGNSIPGNADQKTLYITSDDGSAHVYIGERRIL